MVHLASPPPVIEHVAPALPKVDGENLALVAFELAKEVRAASTRNVAAAKETIEKAAQVKPFEERARDTLRALMEKMGEQKDGRS